MATYQCDNCEWTGKIEEMDECRDVWSRVEPGDRMGFGDCPECGAFCFPEEEAKPAPVSTNSKEVIEDLLGAVSALLTQVEQMQGMFDDSDGKIQEALEAGYDARDTARKAIYPAVNRASDRKEA